MGRSIFLLFTLTFAVGYAVVNLGGDAPSDASASLLLIGLTAIVGALIVFRAHRTSRFDPTVDVAILAFPIYVAFQLIPLPLALLHVVSPVRAEVTEALGGVVALPRYAPLTIAPATTWVYLSRIAGCALIFLLVRQIARRSTFSVWAAAVPLIVIGGLEAAWALTGLEANAAFISGTYYSRDHFAGLLEMILPFALAYGLALLSRGGRLGGFAATTVVGASVLFAAAAAMFVAITLSVSKLGLFSSLGSLFVMGLLGMRWNPSGGRRWPLIAGLVVLGVFAIVFLTPTQFVEQFGEVVSSGTTEGRLPIAKDTLRLFAAYPIFGCGLGAFYPGLTRYQMSGLNVAWVNAHNDYLQLLSELGFIGFLIPAVLVCTVFARSVGAAFSWRAPDNRESGAVDQRERRFLGLGCAGGLTAILIHSTGDYNTYVLANAMVLAWIMGIAASLPSAARLRTQQPGLAVVPERPAAFDPRRVQDAVVLPRAHAPDGHQPGGSRDPRRWWPDANGNHGEAWWLVPWFVFTLGCLLSSYAGAWLVFLNSFHNDRSAEQSFCRFGICDTDVALAEPQIEQSGSVDQARRADLLLDYLPRDPAAPTRWDNAGEALQRAGRTEQARYSFARAVELGPNSASTLLMAADFHFDVGEQQEALALMSRRLKIGSDGLASAVFADIEFRKIPVDETLRTLSPDRKSSRAYWQELTSAETGALEKTTVLWEWMLRRGYIDDQLAREHVNFLIGANRAELAWQSWTRYAGQRAKGYPDTSRIFNGDFESESTGCRFDWSVQPTGGAAIDFDRSVAYSGGRSLRVQFDGTANPSDVGVQQGIFLTPGRYRLSAYLKTKELSTDQGLSLRVVNEDGRVPIDAATEPLKGTSDWTLVETVFEARGSGLVRVSLTRKPTLKFDNLLRGTLWLDQVEVKSEGERSATKDRP